MKLEQGKVISDRYEIKEQLGQGGMAVVYHAHDLKLDRSVTLKIMRDELEEGFIERFYKEAQSVAGLSHANIVKVFDFGEDDGIHYIVMEYVDGTTLKDLIIKKAPFDEESTLGVAVQIANGLLHAHKNEVVHRDIKPQNILVTHDGSVKIADFGIARVAKVTTLTSNANSMGSVHYFSPEQARGGFVDHKSDIYSLGITMFEMATGQLPYDGEAAVTVALKHINDPFPDPQEINPEISDHLRHIILKATEKSSTKRYAAIEDMYRDMKRTINNIDFLEQVSFEDSPTVQISQEDLESIRQHRRDYSEQLRKAYGEDDEFEEEKTDRKVIFAAFATAAVLVALITVALVLLYNNWRPSLVDPPDIIGLTLHEAMQQAENLDLTITMVGQAFNEDHDEGLIIEQSAGPGESLRRGEPIHVIVSLGSAYFPMPDVIHAEIDVALEHLMNLQLVVEERDYADVELATGIVVRTEPPMGQMVSHNQVVILYVSLGPDNSPFSMPSLLGLNEMMNGSTIVEFIQEELRLIVGTVSHAPNVMYPAGVVSWQSIAPGMEALPGQRVDITISTGAVIPSPTPTPTPTPDPDDGTNGSDVPGPEPTPGTPSPQPTPPAQQPVQRTLTINLWDVPEGTETVHMRVYSRDEAGTNQMILNYRIPVGDFPLPLPVTGNGLVQFTIFYVDEGGVERLRAMSDLDFDQAQ